MTPSMVPLVPLVLLQLCGLQLVLGSRSTCWLQENLIQDSHNLLRDLAPPFPLECLWINVNMSYPDSALPTAQATPPQCHRVLRVVYETLNRTREILQNVDFPEGEGGLTWDQSKLDLFQNLQQRLLDEGHCVSTGSHILTSYFNYITTVIQHQDSAPCGLMALRRDLQRLLRMVLRKHHRCLI